MPVERECNMTLRYHYTTLPVLLSWTVGFVPSATAVAGEAKVRERSEIDAKYLWKTDAIFPNDDAWEVELEKVAAMVPGMAKFKGTLSKGPDQLLAFFAMQEKARAADRTALCLLLALVRSGHARRQVSGARRAASARCTSTTARRCPGSRRNSRRSLTRRSSRG